MSCCFTNLGVVPHNEPLNLNIQAPSAGKYVYRLLYMGHIVYREQVVAEAGDDLVVPMPFNEDYNYELKIFDPAGAPLVNAENNNCDTWIFQTIIAIKNDCNNTPGCDADNDPVNPYPYDYTGGK